MRCTRMRMVVIALLSGCMHAPPARAPAAAWTTIAQLDGVTVAVERALYERPGAPHFFVHVRVTNDRPINLAADLRSYFEVFYANQWSASDLEHRDVIDERRRVLPILDEAAMLRASHDRGSLTEIAHGRSLDYYSEFNGSSRAEVDAQAVSAKWVLVAMDGQLRVSDGIAVQRLVPDDATREVAIAAPVAWPTVPAGATVLSN